MIQVDIDSERFGRGNATQAIVVASDLENGPYLRVAEELAANGHDVNLFFCQTKAALREGNPAVLVHATDQVAAEANKQFTENKYQARRYVGMGWGGIMGLRLQYLDERSRFRRHILPGLFASPTWNLERRIFQDSDMNAVKEAFTKNQYTEEGLSEALWSMYLTPLETPVAVVWGNLGKKSYGEVTETALTSIKASNPQTVDMLLQYRTAEGAMRWFGRNMPTVINLGQTAIKR